MLTFQKFGLLGSGVHFNIGASKLTFFGQELGDEKIIEHIKAISIKGKIQHLNLGKNKITDNCIPCIIESFINKRSALQSLDLGTNQISETGAQLLLEALKQEKSTITTLFLKGNQPQHGQPSISQKTLAEIEKQLAFRKNQEKENVGGEKINRIKI